MAIPKLYQRLFRKFCNPEYYEELQGDLEERYIRNVEKFGQKQAAKNYKREVLNMLRLSVIKKSSNYPYQNNSFSMFLSYLKTSYRYLTNNVSYFIINVFGLSAGLAGCLLIFLFVLDKTSYDQFHSDAENIYRISTEYSSSGNNTRFANTPPALVPGMEGKFPEIVEATRMRYAMRVLLNKGEKSFYEDYGFYADSMMLEVFSFELLAGDKSNALDEPNTIVMTEELAMKYFDNPRPIGELIQFNDDKLLKVTGILAPIPKNSHLQFNFLMSFQTYEIPEGYRSDLSSWTWAGFLTYVKTTTDTDIANLSEKVDLLIKDKISPRLKITTNIQPIQDIYLGSQGMVDDLNSHIQSGNPVTIYALSVVSILILLIAGFNFMNLTTATSIRRGREIGLRKVLGANKSSLVYQLLFDTIIISIIALGLAIFWCALVYTNISSYLELESLANPFELLIYLPYTFIFSVLLGIISGLYPSLLLAGFNTMGALKGQLTDGKGFASNVRTGLVIVQFFISIGLIAATFVINNQTKYMRDMSLGLDGENVITIKLSEEDMSNHYNIFKDVLLQNDYVLNVGKAQRLIGEPWPVNGARVVGSNDNSKLVASCMVGLDYIETLDIKLKEGRTFSRKFKSDSLHSIIMNESAVEYFGLENPIGKSVDFVNVDGPRTIVGVVDDFNFASLHEEISPLVMILPTVNVKYIHVRLSPGNVHDKIIGIENDWATIAGGIPLDLNFMDDNLNRLYNQEEKLSSLIQGFSVLAVFLACLGLFGLISFTVNKRMKEIGIRKVLGASVTSIWLLVSRQYILMIATALVLAYPLVNFVLEQWLENFAYHIEISISFFISAGLILLAICLATISKQTIKVATTNPVKILRSE